MASIPQMEYVMSRTPARTRQPLSRDRVLRAALQLADEGGVGALTMQRIGRRLGVEAMSLYRHVRNKDDILDGIVDLVFDEIEMPADRSGWRTVLRARSISMRSALRRHPWAITLMESRMSPGPANLRSHDETLAVLVASGTGATDATHAYNLVDSYVLGFALQEVNFPFADAEELAAVGDQLLAHVPADLYPTLARVSTELLAAGFDYGDEFEFGLDVILEGIERFLASSAVTTTGLRTASRSRGR
jgi:AcrR family transcriptional regulator